MLLPTTWHMTLWQLHALAKRSMQEFNGHLLQFYYDFEPKLLGRMSANRLHRPIKGSLKRLCSKFDHSRMLWLFFLSRVVIHIWLQDIGVMDRTYWELSLHKDTVSRACILKPCHSTPNTYPSTCGFNCWTRLWSWWLRRKYESRVKPMLR